jgi:hypothetical protein
MAGAPAFKVYNSKNEYVAACKLPADAGALVAVYGNGTTIRLGHSKSAILWTEGKEKQPANESFDFVAETVRERLEAHWKKVLPQK